MHALAVGGVDDAAEQCGERLAFGFGKHLQELGLGTQRDLVEASELGPPGWGQRYALTAVESPAARTG